MVREHVDLWRRVWDHIDARGGIGPQAVRVTHQYAHTKKAANETKSQEERRIGNDHADHYANKGRDLHATPSDIAGASKDAAVATVTYINWLAQSRLEEDVIVDQRIKDGLIAADAASARVSPGRNPRPRRRLYKRLADDHLLKRTHYGENAPPLKASR